MRLSTVDSKFAKLLKSFSKAQASSYSNFASLFSVMTHNPSVRFLFKRNILLTKVPHQSAYFQTFLCSHKKSPNSSHHFWNQQSVFLKTLHYSSVPWDKTPLYFYIKNFIWFGQKEPILLLLLYLLLLLSQKWVFHFFRLTSSWKSNNFLV